MRFEVHPNSSQSTCHTRLLSYKWVELSHLRRQYRTRSTSSQDCNWRLVVREPYPRSARSYSNIKHRTAGIKLATKFWFLYNLMLLINSCLWMFMGLSGSFSCLVASWQGAPLEQISIAEPLAKNGETCLSPQAWEHAPCPEVRSDTQCTDPHHSFFRWPAQFFQLRPPGMYVWHLPCCFTSAKGQRLHIPRHQQGTGDLAGTSSFDESTWLFKEAHPRLLAC